jgi:nitrogen-specific signal transduction histidine kinase
MDAFADFLLSLSPLRAFRIFNLIIAVFCAAMMFSMKTETVSRERPWTKYLCCAFVIFALQYLAFSADLPRRTNEIEWLARSDGFVWSELFGIPINWFLMSSAWTLLNRRRRLPRWFFVLVAVDIAAVFLGVFHLRIDDSEAFPETLCRIWGDGITFISLMCFGYASYINTKFYKNRSGMVLGGVIGLLYGGIHLISPFLPNLPTWYASLGWNGEGVGQRLTTVFIFVAAVSKLALLYSAFLITTLENQTLIKLRSKLRESVDKRKVFFSRKGILEAIINAFGADEVKLYIRVPPWREAAEERWVHVYSMPSLSPSEYEMMRESKTPLSEMRKRLTREQEEEERCRAAVSSRGPILSRISRVVSNRLRHEPFAGTEPIRYHGALIGCFTIAKKDAVKFTYSAKQQCRILSEDISVPVQFYRLQESLQILIEGFDKNPGTRPGGSPHFSVELGRRFEDIIHQVLSPVKTNFVLDAGFVAAEGAATREADEGHKVREYECITDEASGHLRIGYLRLEYQTVHDPIDKPSLGYFRAYGEAVASIVTNTFLSFIEQRFDLIIRKLSFELTKTQTLDSWFDEVQKSVKEAELDGFVLYHPELLGSRHLARGNDAADNRAVAKVLVENLPAPQDFLRPLKDSRPRPVPFAPDKLILGMKLPHSEAGLFVGVRRTQFSKELGADSPWCNFLTNLAGIAGNSIDRIIKARQIQSSQIERAEDYLVIETAEKVNFITHELINRIENLNGNAALLKLDLTKLDLDDSLKRPLESRVEEVRREFDKLRGLVEGLHRAAQIPEQSGPCSLEQTLQKVIALHETGSDIEIEFEGIKEHPELADQPRQLPDISLNLPAFIVELTFGNLIRNSLAAIKRRAKGGVGSARAQVRIWAEAEEGEKFVDCFVHDDGAGVSPNIRDSIFNLSVSTTPGRGGWGLFYLRRTLERNAGSIELLHSKPGDTTFHVRLPRFSA